MINVEVDDTYISPFKISMIFRLCWDIFCLKLGISSALKRLQPILRQEAPFPPPKSFWYDPMRPWNIFSNSKQVFVSAAISRASRPVGGATVMARSRTLRACSKECSSEIKHWYSYEAPMLSLRALQIKKTTLARVTMSPIEDGTKRSV
jgi:hypothetical protein